MPSSPPPPPLPPFPSHITSSFYLSADTPGTGGVIKARPEDFFVEELPLYQPSGHGEHLYLFVEKRGIPTMSMVGQLARHFGVRIADIGYAGLKDKHAVTRQLVSIHLPGKRADEAAAATAAFSHDRITILWTDRHLNKLRRGHLAGNRFIIRIRNVEPGKALYAHRTLRTLARTGVPNRTGEQRFGALGNNHLVGRAIILERWREALDLILGPGLDAAHAAQTGPSGEAAPPTGPHRLNAAARALYAAARYAEARAATPFRFHTERRALASLEKGSGPKRAVEAIDAMQRLYFVTAFQSAVFNAVLESRLREGTLGRLVEGDLAWKHDNRAVFAVDAATLAEPDLAARVQRLEVSPSGPMWGADMTRAAGDVDRAELAALEATGVTLDHLRAFALRERGAIEGERKPLRVPLLLPDVEGGADEHGPYIRCAFELPRGAFATVVMSEVIKGTAIEDSDDDDNDDE